jgi:hypothetical protein
MFWVVAILAMATLLTVSPANGELFKSLKYGISFEYPSDLKPDVSNGIIFIGPEGVTLSLGASKVTRNSGTIQDLISQKEEDYRNYDPNLSVVGSKDSIVGGVNAIEKEYLLNLVSNNQAVTIKIRDIYFKNGDFLYYLSCFAPDYFVDRANSDFFDPLINSLKLFSVDQSTEKGIPGFPKYTGKAIWSSPLFADIDGDGSLEVVVGSNEGKLYAWKDDGSEVRGFPFEAKSIIRSSPAFGDVNGDEKGEIVVGSDNGKLYAINGNGSIISGFPKVTEGSIMSSPALEDLNGDKSLEIVVGSMDLGLYSWGKDGSKVCGFPVITGIGSSQTGGWSSPALGDLSGDGSLEVVVGSTKINEQYTIQGNVLAKKTVPSGRIVAVSGKGDDVAGFPLDLDLNTFIGYSSPVLADLNGDGSLEIIFGSRDGLYCLNAKGDNVNGFPVKTDGSLEDSFIAVGDLEGNGKLEIAAGCLDGRLYVWRNDGSDYPGFPIQTGAFVRHVTLGDIDKDGKQEILGGSRDNRVHAWKLDGTEVAGFPKVVLSGVETAPTLGDLEGDGNLELAVGSDDGSFYVWRISQSYGNLQWPMIRQNPQHTGVFSSGMTGS